MAIYFACLNAACLLTMHNFPSDKPKHETIPERLYHAGETILEVSKVGAQTLHRIGDKAGEKLRSAEETAEGKLVSAVTKAGENIYAAEHAIASAGCEAFIAHR